MCRARQAASARSDNWSTRSPAIETVPLVGRSNPPQEFARGNCKVQPGENVNILRAAMKDFFHVVHVHKRAVFYIVAHCFFSLTLAPSFTSCGGSTITFSPPDTPALRVVSSLRALATVTARRSARPF